MRAPTCATASLDGGIRPLEREVLTATVTRANRCKQENRMNIRISVIRLAKRLFVSPKACQGTLSLASFLPRNIRSCKKLWMIFLFLLDYNKACQQRFAEPRENFYRQVDFSHPEESNHANRGFTFHLLNLVTGAVFSPSSCPGPPGLLPGQL